MAGGWWPVARAGDLVTYLSEEEHARLLSAMEPLAGAPGDRILRGGDPARSLILVESGDVEVLDGGGAVLAVVGSGGVVGEVGFLDGQPRTHDVRVRTSCRLRRLTRDSLLALVKNDSLLFAKLTIALAELLAQRFRRAVRALEPARAFATSIMESRAQGEFDEIDELPEEALEILKGLAQKTDKDAAGL